MSDTFKIEIISPERIIFSGETKLVTIPSYEGDMGLLKNHISIITFLRPGKIKVLKSEGNLDEFFVEDGTVEFFNDHLTILSSSAINIKEIKKDFLENLNKDISEALSSKDINDHDRFILNHKLEAIKELNI